MSFFKKDKIATNSLQISSNDIKHGSVINKKFVFNDCGGENISPAIEWSSAPQETKSFALTVYDPDAPTGSGWWHWLLLNIPASQNKIEGGFGSKNSFRLEDDIIQIRNDYGIYGYGGPCPPKGDKAHRYVFTIHALAVEKIDLNEASTAAQAGFMINFNSIGKASFEAFYSN